jgi:deoxycytidine triphosphate deaminase
MLSKSEVSALISAESIGIFYAFDPASPDESHVESPLNVRTDNRGQEIFDQNFFGNRLGITLGPLVYSHNYSRSNDRQNFRHRKSVFDLRDTNGKILLRPGENITVNSIESIRLGEKWGAITLPRLTHATMGVVLSASYIDPLWDGVLVFHIVNHGRFPIELQIGEKIGACHFYEVASTDLSTNDAFSFANKSHHYGQNWKKIIVDDADPFPQKKKSSLPVKDENILAVKQFIKEWWVKTLGGLGVVTILGVILWIGATMNEYKDLPAQVKHLQRQNLSAEERTVTVPISRGTTSTTQSLKIQAEEGTSLLLVFASPNVGNSGVSTSANVVTNEEGDRQVRLLTTVDAASDADRSFNISYVIVLKNEPK